MSSFPTEIYGHKPLSVTNTEAPSRRSNRMNQENLVGERSYSSSICCPCNHSYLQNETHLNVSASRVSCCVKTVKSGFEEVLTFWSRFYSSQVLFVSLSGYGFLCFTQISSEVKSIELHANKVSNPTYLHACDCHTVFSVQHKSTVAWVLWKLLSVWNIKRDNSKSRRGVVGGGGGVGWHPRQPSSQTPIILIVEDRQLQPKSESKWSMHLF